MNSIFLEYLTIIRFIIENVTDFKSVDDIISRFQGSIEDITNDDELHLSQLIAMNIPGHENYLFKFREDKNTFGEFSVDFIPFHPEEFVKNGIRELSGSNTNPSFTQKHLANFRAQLFTNDSLILLKEKKQLVFSYLTNQFGDPNKPPRASEQSQVLTANIGVKIDCWNLYKESDEFILTLYLSEIDRFRFYVSFSISLN